MEIPAVMDDRFTTKEQAQEAADKANLVVPTHFCPLINRVCISICINWQPAFVQDNPPIVPLPSNPANQGAEWDAARIPQTKPWMLAGYWCEYFSIGFRRSR